MTRPAMTRLSKALSGIVLLLGFALCVLPRPTPALAQSGLNPKPESADDHDLDRRREKANSIQQEITRLRAQAPPDYAAIAGLYQALFALFPKEQQGKLAIWEAYHTYVKIKDPTSALAMLRLIYRTYGIDDTMDNPFPLENTRPIHLHATADIEQAVLYARFFNAPEAAVAQLHNVPARRPGVYVGSVDGDHGYYGPVEAITWLKIAESQVMSGRHNDALTSLRTDLMEGRGIEIGRPYGWVPLDVAIMRQVRNILLAMPASLTKKQVELDELMRLSWSDLAKANGHWTRARLYVKQFEDFHNPDDITQAEREYSEIVEKFGDLPYPTSRGTEAMGPRAVVATVKLYSSQNPDPQKLVLVLNEMERLAKAKAAQSATEAYARLHRAGVFLEKLNNPAQAIEILGDFGRDFPEVVVYPFTAANRVMLFETANRVTRTARERLSAPYQNLGAP